MGLKLESAALSGTARYGPIDLSVLSTYGTSVITWAASTPTNTALTVQTAITSTAAAPSSGDYAEATSGSEIPGLEENQSLASCYLWILVTLTSSVAGTTPELTSLSYSLQEPQLNDRLVLKLLPGMRCPIAPVVIEYDAASGGQSGPGGAVENYSINFTPSGFDTPHPNRNENISMTASAESTLTQIYYANSQLLENIDVTASAVSTLIHVDDLNT